MLPLKNELSKLNDIKQNIKNWYVVPLFKYGLIKKATFVTRRGDRAEIRNNEDYYTFFSGRKWGIQKLGPVERRVSITENCVILDNKFRFAYHHETELGATLLMMGEVQNDEYASLEVSGRAVIDIGANIADSAIYFISKGAASVIAFEPFPATYRQAKENIELNGMGGRITLLNMGVGGKRRKVRLPTSFIGTSGMDSIGKSALGQNSGDGEEIDIITLADIAEMYPEEGVVVKMDCEGCEYAAILGAENETLRHFSAFILEYHSGSSSLIKKFNEAGFKPELKSRRILLAVRKG